MSATPNILVPWEPRWRALRDGVRPALQRSGSALALECDRGLPRISFATSLCLHATLVLAVLGISDANAVNQVSVKQLVASEHVTYFSGRELPAMEDASGAESGTSGAAGGRELFHPTQTIRVSHGQEVVERISEVPSQALPLPRAALADVAYLISVPAMPAPPPAPVVRASSRPDAAPQMPALPAAAAPSVAALASRHDVVRGAVDAPRRSAADVRLAGTDVAALPPPEPVSRMTHAPILPPPGAADALPTRGLPQVAAGNALADVVGPAPSPQSLARTTTSAIANAPAPTLASGNGNTPGATGAGANKADGRGVILSAHPGAVVGVPAASSGTLAMSPQGGSAAAGAGGSGGGTGIGAGRGSGAAARGTGPGAGAQGTGFGADLHATGGISPGPGPGGTGSGGATPQIAGVTIRGSSVTLGSFASATTVPTGDARRVLGPRKAPAITVVGTSRAGGAMNRYGVLKGAKVYTIYVDTRLGPAVVEFSERPSTTGPFQSDLTPPEPLSSDFPATLVDATRIVVQCVIDREGSVRDVKVLDGNANGPGAALLAALQNWHFRPVLRGDEAVEVDAIIGFGVDTR